jgi:hypothetical protein
MFESAALHAADFRVTQDRPADRGLGNFECASKWLPAEYTCANVHAPRSNRNIGCDIDNATLVKGIVVFNHRRQRRSRFLTMLYGGAGMKPELRTHPPHGPADDRRHLDPADACGTPRSASGAGILSAVSLDRQHMSCCRRIFLTRNGPSNILSRAILEGDDAWRASRAVPKCVRSGASRPPDAWRHRALRHVPRMKGIDL